jgi:hypothetical protein
MFDGRRKTGTNDWTTLCRVGGSPVEGMWRNTMLVWISCSTAEYSEKSTVNEIN